MTDDGRNTAFAQFMGAHLPTAVERGVFWVLAGSLSEVWTAVGVAREARVSDHEADEALRRFAAAGILERLDDPGQPRRYRWRPEMSYLHEGSDPPGRIDPVCGMPVPAGSPHIAQDEGEGEVVFCSLPCLVRWRSEHRGGSRRFRLPGPTRTSPAPTLAPPATYDAPS
jgi:YHS domain-containing protein